MTNEIKEIEHNIDELERVNGVESVCKKGCAACCKQCIVVFSSEIPAIENCINGYDPETKEKIREKTLELCTYLTEKGITNDRPSKCISRAMQIRLQEEYFSLGRDCIFLDENNACRIHPVRPSLCWSYREYSDPEKCKESCFSDTGVKFDDWERKSSKRLVQARKPNKHLMILPFAVKEAMHW